MNRRDRAILEAFPFGLVEAVNKAFPDAGAEIVTDTYGRRKLKLHAQGARARQVASFVEGFLRGGRSLRRELEKSEDKPLKA